MPLYEYDCHRCDKTFEKIVKRSDPTPPCPECEQNDEVVRQEVSKSSFALKGGGWYKNGTH